LAWVTVVVVVVRLFFDTPRRRRWCRRPRDSAATSLNMIIFCIISLLSKNDSTVRSTRPLRGYWLWGVRGRGVCRLWVKWGRALSTEYATIATCTAPEPCAKQWSSWGGPAHQRNKKRTLAPADSPHSRHALLPTSHHTKPRSLCSNDRRIRSRLDEWRRDRPAITHGKHISSRPDNSKIRTRELILIIIIIVVIHYNDDDFIILWVITREHRLLPFTRPPLAMTSFECRRVWNV